MNQIGDCVIAAAGHMEMVWSFNADDGFVPSDHDIMMAYGYVGGYVAADPSTDKGADPLTCLKYWRKQGIAGRKIEGFASVNPSNQDRLMQSVSIFENSYLALGLPAALQNIPDGDPWDIPAGQPLTGEWLPGSWGGHMVESPKYDENYCYIVTWGNLVPVSWRFLMTYCDEAYACWSKDMLDNLGRTPTGLDVAALSADLQAIDHDQSWWKSRH